MIQNKNKPMHNDKLFFDLPKNSPSSIKVIGVGGGGNNAVNYMYNQGITGVDFVVCNTDAQALANSPVPIKIQLGSTITEGLGAGANPEIGEQSAIESIDEIKNILSDNTKMLFITAGMGGGTGTGAAPVIAACAKEMGVLTVGIVTIPFSFEGRSRLEQAQKGLEKFRKNVDSLIVINNDKLRELFGNLGYKSGFAKADEILSTAAKGIAEVITQNYTINIDLRDAKTVLSNSGTAIMGSARASGTNKAQEAIKSALDSPLLNDNKITGAKNVLLLIVSGEDEITIDEIGIINDYIQNEAGYGTNIIMGIGEDESLGDSINVTIIATGFPIDDEKNSGNEKIYHTLKDEPVQASQVSSKGVKNISQDIKKKEDEEWNDFKVINKSLKSNKSIEQTKEDKPIRFILEDEEEITNFSISKDPKNNHNNHNNNDDNINNNIVNNKYNIKETKENKDVKDIENGHSFIKKTIKIEKMDSEEPDYLKNSDNENTFLKKDFLFNQEINEVIFNLDDNKTFDTGFLSQYENENENENILDDSTLDSGIEEDEMENIIDVEKQLKEEQEYFENKIAVNTFTEADNVIIGSEMEKKIQERRDRLKLLNSKYQNMLKNNIDEIEKTPAYKRQGIDLEEVNDKESGNVTLNRFNEIEIKPNNFFHDRVD